jgi:S-DNA-T family DNA segregation ATPase FtsK/SpoIIIE
VVTGLIKANFPARISFLVASSVDSRVVLDSSGAEDLLGRGDMLLLDPTKGMLQRAQGTIITDTEIDKVLNHWQRISRREAQDVPWESMIEAVSGSAGEDSDALIEQAAAVVKAAGKASVSLLQRRLRVGFPRAARLIDELEEMGIIGPSVGSGRDREVLDNENENEDSSESQY